MGGYHDHALQHVQECKEAEMPPAPSWPLEAGAPEQELPLLVALWKLGLFLQHDKSAGARETRQGSHQQHVRSLSSDSCHSSAHYLYEVTWWCSFLKKKKKEWIAFIMGPHKNRMS